MCSQITECVAGLEYLAIPPTATSDAGTSLFCVPLRTSFLPPNLSRRPPSFHLSQKVCDLVSSCRRLCDNDVLSLNGGSCDCGIENCAACAVEGSIPVCILCAAPTYLIDGVCRSTCPNDTSPLALTVNGREHRLCVADGTSEEDVAFPSLQPEFEVEAPTSSSDRECRAVRTCLPNEYETLFPTITRDRVCRSLTVCETGAEFQSAAPTATSDRVCTPLTDCRAGTTTERVQPTATSDRVCGGCTVCPDALTISEACTPLSDTVCADCTVCSPGVTFALRACSLVSDTICADCTPCVSGVNFLSRACAGPDDNVCTACTRCSSNQYRTRPCTPVQDAQCRALTQCSSTEYETRAPTATTDR